MRLFVYRPVSNRPKGDPAVFFVTPDRSVDRWKAAVPHKNRQTLFIPLDKTSSLTGRSWLVAYRFHSEGTPMPPLPRNRWPRNPSLLYSWKTCAAPRWCRGNRPYSKRKGFPRRKPMSCPLRIRPTYWKRWPLPSEERQPQLPRKLRWPPWRQGSWVVSFLSVVVIPFLLLFQQFPQGDVRYL